VARCRAPIPDQIERVRDIVDGLVRGTYTMEVERKTHELVLGGIGFADEREDAA
jgi:hypothetical protein